MTEENKKVQTIEIGDKTYNVSDLTDEQVTLVTHVQQLDNKIASARFNLDQLVGGRNYFMEALKQALSEDKS